MKRWLKKLWANRPFRTFIQGFIGTFAGSYIVDMDFNAVKALIISSVMAGLSALMLLNTGEE